MRRMVAPLQVTGRHAISLEEFSWVPGRGSADGAIRMDGMLAPVMRTGRVGLIGLDLDTIGLARSTMGRLRMATSVMGMCVADTRTDGGKKVIDNQ
jgi:hypothetical protein